jgi:hypothetical protein
MEPALQALAKRGIGHRGQHPAPYARAASAVHPRNPIQAFLSDFLHLRMAAILLP